MVVLTWSLHTNSSELLILYWSLPFCATSEIYSTREIRYTLRAIQIVWCCARKLVSASLRIATDSSQISRQVRHVREETASKITELRGGQKSHVSFAKLGRYNARIFILDWPTNLYDVERIDALTMAASEFEGRMMLILRDMRLVSKVAIEIRILWSQRACHASRRCYWLWFDCSTIDNWSSKIMWQQFFVSFELVEYWRKFPRKQPSIQSIQRHSFSLS